VSAELSQSPGTPGSGPLPLLSAAEIDAAAKRIAGVVTPTPLQFSDRLSATTGASVYLKREDLQVVRSYKLRGALVGGKSRAGIRLRMPITGRPRSRVRAGQDAEAKA
jgi:hypothetical protein